MEPGVPESFNVLIRELAVVVPGYGVDKANEKKPVVGAAAVRRR